MWEALVLFLVVAIDYLPALKQGSLCKHLFPVWRVSYYAGRVNIIAQYRIRSPLLRHLGNFSHFVMRLRLMDVRSNSSQGSTQSRQRFIC